MAVRTVYVDCRRGGELIKSYEFGEPIGMLPGSSSSDEQMKGEAKSQLTTDGLAFPPYPGITFTVRRS